jgi:hypothetical protein
MSRRTSSWRGNWAVPAQIDWMKEISSRGREGSPTKAWISPNVDDLQGVRVADRETVDAGFEG